MLRSPLATLALSLAFALGALPASIPEARAQPPALAPGLDRELARNEAAGELERLVATLRPTERKRVEGVYVAVDANASDAFALAACDDDGDYAVVLSDAMLTLVDNGTAAMAADELQRTHKFRAYAASLAEAPRGVRVAPLPPGFFERLPGGGTNATARELELAATRRREALAGLIAHELAHMIAGDLTCPAPTATHELGDEVWTHEEQERALRQARFIYTPERVASADAASAAAALDAGRTEIGVLGLLPLLDGYPLFTRLHGTAGTRAPRLRAAANLWRESREKGGIKAP